MEHHTLTRRAALAVLAAGSLAATGLAAAPSHAAGSAELYVVQGLPNLTLDVAVDGKVVARGVQTARVAGPFKVQAGKRKVTLSDGGKQVVSRMVDLGAGTSTDAVAHLQVEGSAAPVMTAYKNDLTAVPQDKASLTVAHTAAVPPADIRVNGKVLFAEVANGESLSLVVPVATYKVDIVPTGKSAPVFLGPLDLTVQGGKLNKVYAVGDPSKRTMNVAVHFIALGATGSGQPRKVDTGTGGQALGQGGALWVDLLR